MNKDLELKKIAKEIEKCRRCKIGTSGLPVAGEGDVNAKIVFLGEAPGKQEAMVGRPFIGRAGKVLRALIKEAGIDENKVYITSPVKYLPDRGTPSSSEIEHGKTHLLKQLSVLRPQFVVLLGSTAVFAMLGIKIPIFKKHGSIIEKEGRTYFLTLHPAAILHQPNSKPLLLSDFKKLKKLAKQYE